MSLSFKKKPDHKTKILAVAESKNINSASSNEHLKIGVNAKKGVIMHLQMVTTDEGGMGGLNISLETHFFMLYNIPKFGAILRGRPTKVTGKKKYCPYIIFCTHIRMLINFQKKFGLLKSDY